MHFSFKVAPFKVFSFLCPATPWVHGYLGTLSGVQLESARLLAVSRALCKILKKKQISLTSLAHVNTLYCEDTGKCAKRPYPPNALKTRIYLPVNPIAMLVLLFEMSIYRCFPLHKDLSHDSNLGNLNSKYFHQYLIFALGFSMFYR